MYLKQNSLFVWTELNLDPCEMDFQRDLCITNFGKNVSGDIKLKWARTLTPR